MVLQSCTHWSDIASLNAHLANTCTIFNFVSTMVDSFSLVFKAKQYWILHQLEMTLCILPCTGTKLNRRRYVIDQYFIRYLEMIAGLVSIIAETLLNLPHYLSNRTFSTVPIIIHHMDNICLTWCDRDFVLSLKQNLFETVENFEKVEYLNCIHFFHK